MATDGAEASANPPQYSYPHPPAYAQPPTYAQQAPQPGDAASQSPYGQPAHAPQLHPAPPYPASPYAQAPQQQAAYQQQAFYGWVAQAPFPPPKPSLPRRTVAIASALVLAAVLALAAGLAMARPSGGSAAKPTGGAAAQDAAVRAVWRSVPITQLLPASIKREGTETYIRVGISPDESCSKLPAAFAAALAPAKCAHVLAATYADRTQTVTATVGIVVIGGSIADRLRLFQTWTADADASNAAMMPNTYPVPGTVAAAFADTRRVAWQSQMSSDGTYLVYAVAGFADGRDGSNSGALAASAGSALSSSSPAVQVAGDLPGAIQDLLSVRIQAARDGAS